MAKLYATSENGVIYIENDDKQVFGIVSATEITDEEGIKYEKLPLEVLESNGFEIEQDWENESSFIEFKYENGESSKVVFSADSVEIK
jgi:hypothetical protein